MRAVVYHAPRDIRLERVEVPKPRPDEIVIKVGAALTCGTDFKAYRQGHKVLLGSLPARFGHEVAGTVVDVGYQVRNFHVGDRVVAANSAPCDGCFYCDRGQNQLCERLKLHNGAYADYDCIPANIVARNTWKLPDDLAFDVAALSEPLACAVHGVAALDVKKGESATVIGAGPMSLLLIQALKARGARVHVIGRDEANLELARKSGADATFSTRHGGAYGLARAASGGPGPDHVFESVGKEETWREAVSLARPGGRVCLFGGCAAGTMVPFDAHRIHYSQLSLFGVFHHTPKYFKEALDLLAAGKIKTELLIRGKIELDQVPDFFRANAEKSGAKVAVLP